MAKRPNPRSIKAARNYTVPEAAISLGVSLGTIRAWIKAGLPVLNAQRPTLILGSDLRAFLVARRSGKKSKLGPDQLYCLRCKQGHAPYGMMVDFIPHSATTGRLVGLCSECGTTCNRMISAEHLNTLRQIFDIACRDPKRA